MSPIRRPSRPSDRSSPRPGVGAHQVGVGVLGDHPGAGPDGLGRYPGRDVHLEPAVRPVPPGIAVEQAGRAVLDPDARVVGEPRPWPTAGHRDLVTGGDLASGGSGKSTST